MPCNPFLKIFEPYFDRLTDIFGNLADETIRNNSTPQETVREYLGIPLRRLTFRDKALPNICMEIELFWKENGSRVLSELSKLNGLKARYGGDFGPSSEENIFQCAGLYFDTIIVPDPMLRVARAPDDISKHKDIFILERGIEQVLMKDVYLADLNPPIAIIIPDAYHQPGWKDFKTTDSVSKIDMIAIINELYDLSLDTYEGVLDLFSKFESASEAAKEISNPSMLLFSKDVPLEPELQLEAIIAETEDWFDLGKMNVNPSSPITLLKQIEYRLLQVNDSLISCEMLGAHPLISNPISFHWLKTKINTCQELIFKKLGTKTISELTITNSMLSKRLKWLSNVHLDSLIKLRKSGQLENIRSTIRKSIENVSDLTLDSFEQVESEVDYGLSEALKRHKDELDKLDKELRSKVLIQSTSLVLPVAVSFLPIFGIIPQSLVASAIGIGSLTQIINTAIDHMKNKRNLSNSHMGVLWDAKEKSMT